MRESLSYFAILDEGREMELRYLIRDIAKTTLGEPDAQSLTCLEGITNVDQLRRILKRVGLASTWQNLLDTP